MKITKEMGIADIVGQYPETVEVFRRFGMGCFGWAAARFENVAQGALAHGISDIDSLIVELNKAAK